jgi:hypothetical protein
MCSHTVVHRCIFLASRPATRCCIFLGRRYSWSNFLPAPICSHAASPRYCTFLARAAACRCIFLASPRCCLPLHFVGLPHKYPCSLAGTNLQPRYCIVLVSRAGIHARSPAPMCSRAAARRCNFLASRAGIHARSPALLCSPMHLFGLRAGIQTESR